MLILMYHSISVPKTKSEVRYACPPVLFEKHMRYLTRNFRIVGIDDIIKHTIERKPYQDKTVAVTIDDGFLNNYENAFPILKKYHIPATIFLTVQYIGKTNGWMVKEKFPDRKMLNWNQIIEMSQNGISFGAHTMTHPRLTQLSPEEVYREAVESKSIIENKLNQKIDVFAYPYGLGSQETINAIKKANFKIAVSTRSGFNRIDTDPFFLRRIEVYGNDPVWKLSQKVTFGINDAGIHVPLKYYANRIFDKLSFNQSSS